MPAVVSLEAKRVEKLSAKAATGDREAFGALYDRYHAELLSYARRRLPTLEDAEDLVEHAFYKALRSIPRKDPRSPFNVWLFHIAKNLITDFYRTQKRHEPIEDEVSVIDSAEEEALRGQLGGPLSEAVSGLTDPLNRWPANSMCRWWRSVSSIDQPSNARRIARD